MKNSCRIQQKQSTESRKYTLYVQFTGSSEQRAKESSMIYFFTSSLALLEFRDIQYILDFFKVERIYV
jgi:hypothetical protein